jgi:DNA replication protein DnaC
MTGFWGLATVTKVEPIHTDSINGYLVHERYADIGYDTAAVFLDDGNILEERSGERRSRSGMPTKYNYTRGKDFNWDIYDEKTDRQRQLCNAFIVNFEMFRREGRGLYIFSETKGSGKTMLSCALANEVLKKFDLSVKFIRSVDFAELVKSKSDDDKAALKSLYDAGLLIFDDIGAGLENKDWISTALFRLIDKRDCDHMPTIFTSNLHWSQLDIDDRIAQRLGEVCVPIAMPEISIRNKIADQHTEAFIKSVLADDAE